MSNIVKKYLNGSFAEGIDVFETLEKEIDSTECTRKELHVLRKLMEIFFIGQLVGLPTMKSILTRYEIINNYHQLNCKNICKKLSNSFMRKIFELIFEKQVLSILKNMLEKHRSVWSKIEVTAVVDDSIFRQWLQNETALASFEKCYGKFFSGQFKASVYGQKVVTFGLSIDNVFYPLYFGLAKKTPKNSKVKEETAAEEAIKLVKKWGDFIRKNRLNELLINKIHFSCDNGYSHVGLEKACEENGLTYISVPKSNHYFIINNKKWKLSDYIAQHFLPAEQMHLQNEIELPKEEKTPFFMRLRAEYQAYNNKNIVLLLFRLNGSRKVSAIYCTNLDIHAKTLRRHWFQRTYIEQFFRLLKHTLLIGQPTTRTKQDFEFKLFRFFFIALHAQKLVTFFRKKHPEYKKIGFQVIQRQLACNQDFFDLLQRIIV